MREPFPTRGVPRFAAVNENPWIFGKSRADCTNKKNNLAECGILTMVLFVERLSKCWFMEKRHKNVDMFEIEPDKSE